MGTCIVLDMYLTTHADLSRHTMANHEHMVQIMLEIFNAPTMYVARQAVGSL